VLLIKEKCYIGNIGNSRAVLFRITPTGETVAYDLSNEHTPEREDEKERILKNGGKIE